MGDNLAGSIVLFGAGLIIFLYGYPQYVRLLDPVNLTLYSTVGLTLYVFSS